MTAVDLFDLSLPDVFFESKRHRAALEELKPKGETMWSPRKKARSTK